MTRYSTRVHHFTPRNHDKHHSSHNRSPPVPKRWGWVGCSLSGEVPASDNIGRKTGTSGPLPQREAQRTTLTAAKISLGFPIRHKTNRQDCDDGADIYL
ncbi:hypothetical protein SNOG_03946 [Parastagonospora nodorum SN15]|uniref:Uncharacterized protein n=1 Tax=Phaeosphaeria nodorum (strain SN15 / ATCC MYA-4574 / FGSC 10173) TaxID=321614 RepID=Q0UWB8_PHANO|nr:hypothetical protein SNOG_03946 [Parastagonospora nodorum SN15]EAT89151.1 hypothetical protein SNOG_03946 [Parastagonospora nodorum SN15]